MEPTPYQQALYHLQNCLLVIQPQLEKMEREEVQAVKNAAEFVIDAFKKMEATK